MKNKDITQLIKVSNDAANEASNKKKLKLKEAEYERELLKKQLEIERMKMEFKKYRVLT